MRTNITILKNLRAITLITGIVIGATLVFALQKINPSNNLSARVLPGSAPPVCGLSQMPSSSTTSGIIGTSVDFNSAVTAYQQAHPNNAPNVTWGGMIGKNQLIAIINSLGPEATEVNYKFITNSGDNKTSIYFEGGTFNAVNGDQGSTKLYIRTGSASDAFCPPRCQ